MEGVRSAGGEPDLLIVAEEGVASCTGCNRCSVTGECVIRDTMQEIYPRVDSAGALVVSSPVYFATVPGVLKAFYDRMQPYWARVHRLGGQKPDPRPGAFLVVGGGGDPFGFSAAIDPTRSVFAVLGVGYEDELAVEGPDAPGEMAEYPDALEEAFEIGARLVSRTRDMRIR